MKQTINNLLAIAALVFVFTACDKEDSLNDQSVLPVGELDNSAEGIYLRETFEKPFGIRVNYNFDRNHYGSGRDALRNLTPPQRKNVIPAMEMVEHIWIDPYRQLAGKEFLDTIRPIEFLLAGGFAFNNDGTRTLGLASAGVTIVLYELDYLKEEVYFAQQFIHTIQHEYIHIINMKQEFDENEFGSDTRALYTPNWYERPSYEAYFADYMTEAEYDALSNDELANRLGFVTSYARSNIFEDFAETASYLLTHTEQEYNAMLDEITSKGFRTEANNIRKKAQRVRDYFQRYFELDFDELCRLANENAESAPMLNGFSTNSNTESTFGFKTRKGKSGVSFCQGHADMKVKLK